jgi:hypothetical protein
MATGKPLGEARPKGDTTSLTMLDQAGVTTHGAAGSSDDQ